MKKCQSLLKAYFILLFCINYFFFINCDDACSPDDCISDGFNCNDNGDNVCPNDCKPKYGTNQCYHCPNDRSYYYIDTDGNCVSNADYCPAGTKIIKETNECKEGTETLNDLFFLGGIYYKDNCPENSFLISPSKECKCKNYYYIEKIGDIEMHFCLAQNEIPPDANYKYYNYGTKEFHKGTSCPTELTKKKNEIKNDREVFRCSNNCIGEEFEFENVCVDSCTGTQKIYIEGAVRKCLVDCSGVLSDLYEKGGYCVAKSECKFYIENKCIESCLLEENGFIYHNFNDNECIEECTGDYKYLDEVNKICYKEENCNYINEDENRCLTLCEGFLIQGQKKCYTTCPSTTPNKQYHNYDSNFCIEDCSSGDNDKNYHKDGSFICYPSCKDIPGGNYIYEKSNGACSDTDTSCSYYISKEHGIKKCLTADECFDMDFKFVFGKECKKGDDVEDYFKLYENPNPTNPLIKIVRNLDDCFIEGFKFYNLDSKKCWKNMPNNHYVKEKDGEKYKVIIDCPNFYYKNTGDSNLNYCTNTCIEKGLFFFIDQKQCLDKCEITIPGTPKFFYYDPSNNECLDSCNGRTGHEFYYEITSSTSTHQECLSECPPDKFYDTNKKIIDSCIFISSSNPKLCVERCEPNEKVDNDNHCVLNCPHNYVKTRISGISFEIKKCVDDCSVLTENKFLDLKNKECITEVDCNNNYYKSDDFCYPKCYGNNYYIDSNTYTCLSKCPDELNKAELIPGTNPNIFICKNTCPDIEYFLNGKCITECPESHNYIGNNNICVQTCKSDPRGEYYYDTEYTTSGGYKIYKCTISCNIIGGSIDTYYIIPGTKECLKECPPGYKYIVENTNECLSKCPDDFPFYDNSAINSNGHIFCKNTLCSGSDQYFLDGACKTKNDCIAANKKYINSKKICLDKCKEKFKIKNAADETYDCSNSCDFFIEDNAHELECVSHCPKEKKFIGANGKCLDNCLKEDGLNYYKFSMITLGDGTQYPIYKCIEGCNEDYHLKIEGKKECCSTCPESYPFISDEENTCYSNCLNSLINPFTLDDGTNKKCVRKCEGTSFPNYGENKICINGCDSLVTNIKDHDGKCVSQCDKSSTYKYNDNNECKDSCSTTGRLRYSKNDYLCKEKCTGDEIYLTETGNECLSDCKPLEYKKIYSENDATTNTFAGEIRCLLNYGENFYYAADRILLPQCKNNDYFVVDTHECVPNCESINTSEEKYHFYEFETPPTGITPTFTKNACVKECPIDKKFLLENNHCSSDCNLNYKYHLENDYKCLIDCPDNFYKDGTKCVDECKGTNKYLNGNNCIEYCPEEKKYFIDSAEIKKCLSDCSVESPYYYEEELSPGSPNKIYKCKGDCSYNYIVNEDPNINAKKCLYNGEACPGYKSEENEKECFTVCPPNKYIDNVNRKCLNECPLDYYHEKDSFLCIKPEDCQSKLADLETKLCVPKCETKYKKEIKDTSGSSTIAKICLKECNSDSYGIYSTPDNICVNDCTGYSTIPYLKEDPQNGKCICKKYYYFDNNIMKCFDPSKENCKEASTSLLNYPILMFGTFQCLKYCNKILSLNGDYCYEESNACSSLDDINSQVFLTENGKKCECPSKFYKIGDKKKCLGESTVCPTNYYVPETQECINSCPSTHPFLFKDTFCLKICPKGATTSGTTCDCGNKFWYEASIGNYECLEGSCLDIFPVYAPESNQCLKKCSGTYYPFLYDQKCYSSCSIIPNTENAVQVSISSDLAKYSCQCIDPWYLDQSNNNKMMCPARPNSIEDCLYYNSPTIEFMIKETKQCLNECPIEYPYSFNRECFTSCENHAKSKYLYNVKKVGNSFECQCVSLWHYSDAEKKKKNCINENINECIEYDSTFTYMIDKTKECILNEELCPTNSYLFNYVCYDKCPENTVHSAGEHDCTCNKYSGYWHEYEKNNRKYSACGLTECPKYNNENNEYIRMNLLEKENKCLISCGEDEEYQYALRNICIKTCPFYTESLDNECLFYDLNDEEHIDSLEKLKGAANVQAKELYENSAHLGGYLFNKFDTSLQIYAIDKSNSLKELSTKSNLTYIDFGTCINKIFEDNNLSENDKILIAKYDLATRNNGNNNDNGENGADTEDEAGDGDGEEGEPEENNPVSENSQNKEKYLINQVEYELFSSKTMEKIDASICQPYELLISYPIFFNKNRFNNYIGSSNQNEYKIKFEIGKELHKKNPQIDTFHFNNSVYKDICLGVEIQGKDLVLEDRYQYLYPNNASLCESNCTINYTDYDLERIVCSCTYKEVFDFNRKEEDRNDKLNDQNFELTKQSSANGQIIQCLAKISIIKNEAFYYCLTVTIIEVSMVFVSAFYGVNYIYSNLVSLMNKANNNIDLFNNENKGYNKPKNGNEIIPSTQRALNNPPKKSSNDEPEEENNPNIVYNKNIEINNNKIFDLDQKNSKSNNNGNLNFDLSKNIDNKVKTNFKAEYIPTSYNFNFLN